MTTKYFEVTFTSRFSNKQRTTVVKARDEKEAIANAKNIRPAHNFTNSSAIEVPAQPTAKGVGAQHNNH